MQGAKNIKMFVYIDMVLSPLMLTYYMHMEKEIIIVMWSGYGSCIYCLLSVHLTLICCFKCHILIKRYSMFSATKFMLLKVHLFINNSLSNVNYQWRTQDLEKGKGMDICIGWSKGWERVRGLLLQNFWCKGKGRGGAGLAMTNYT